MSRASAALLVSLVPCACRSPTEIFVHLRTDACGPSTSTIVRAGPEDRSRTSGARVDGCPGGEPDNVGSIVLYPSGDKSARVLIEVHTGVGGTPSTCAEGDPGCIVARRLLRYAPHERLDSPIEMRAVCSGIKCDPTETCMLGTCRQADTTAPDFQDDTDDAGVPDAAPETSVDGALDAFDGPSSGGAPCSQGPYESLGIQTAGAGQAWLFVTPSYLWWAERFGTSSNVWRMDRRTLTPQSRSVAGDIQFFAANEARAYFAVPNGSPYELHSTDMTDDQVLGKLAGVGGLWADPLTSGPNPYFTIPVTNLVVEGTVQYSGLTRPTGIVTAGGALFVVNNDLKALDKEPKDAAFGGPVATTLLMNYITGTLTTDGAQAYWIEMPTNAYRLRSTSGWSFDYPTDVPGAIAVANGTVYVRDNLKVTKIPVGAPDGTPPTVIEKLGGQGAIAADGACVYYWALDAAAKETLHRARP
jgi:hypothetical protein